MRINNFKLIQVFQLNEIIGAVSESDIKTLLPSFYQNQFRCRICIELQWNLQSKLRKAKL